jgi:MATE family multidrug resistance protein
MTRSIDTGSATRSATSAGGFREVFGLAAPVVLTQLSATAMGVVDSAMVGRLGPTQLAAVGFGATWLFTVFSLFYGTASGVQTFVSQADGSGRPERGGPWTWQGGWAVVPASLLFVLAIVPWLDDLARWLGPSLEMQAGVVSYTRARLPGEVGLCVFVVLSSFFRGFGDARTPLYATLLMNVVNAALDYALIFGHFGLPRLGVAGAGVAYAVACWVGAAVLFAAFRRAAVSRRHRTGAVPPTAAAIRRFLRTSAAIGGQWCVGMTTWAVFVTLVARMGDDAMAATQAVAMLLSLSFMQAEGIAIAASTLIGRHVGAERPGAAERTLHSGLGLGAVIAAVVALLFVAIPDTLLRVFTDDPDVIALGRPLLRLGALFQLFDAMATILDGALRGAGDTRWPFAVEVALGWGFFLPLAWWLGVYLDGGLTAAWTGALLGVLALAVVLLWRFLSGAWRTISI